MRQQDSFFFFFFWEIGSQIIFVSSQVIHRDKILFFNTTIACLHAYWPALYAWPEDRRQSARYAVEKIFESVGIEENNDPLGNRDTSMPDAKEKKKKKMFRMESKDQRKGSTKTNYALHSMYLVYVLETRSRRQRTISSVHTRRIQTFSLPSMPSTPSSSTPSHQHRRAGFRQKRRSFCAIPTAFVFARSLPRISVRRRASAKLQMTALLGSPAR